MKKHLAFLFLPFMVLGLASCNIYDLVDRTSGNSFVPPLTSDGHYVLDNPTPFTYRDLQLSAGMDALPSTGEYTVLVLPIEMSDFPFASSAMTDLDTVLNSPDGTSYWESLSSFYYKSSYGQLKVDFEIAPIYQCGMTASQAYSKYGTNIQYPDNGISLIDAALKNYKKDHRTAGFDSDSNGWIDGIVAVYSCPDSQSYDYPFNDLTNFYWAYTYWAQQDPNHISPSFNLYFWLSIDFIYTADGELDAHTLIHEFGHMLGLDDYYPSSTSKSPYNAFFPVGWLDMMDGNVLDHNAFSKMALGWIKPTVVADECTVELKPLQDGANAIVLPSASWNGSAFDEYLIFELYTPTGLNELDSAVQYTGRPIGFQHPGVKILHVDARVMEITLTSSGKGSGEYLEGTTLNPSSTSQYLRYYQVGATNSQKISSYAEDKYSLVSLIDASSPSVSPFYRQGNADDGSLFHAGDTFSLQDYSVYFPEGTTLNNGEELNYSVSISYCGYDKATLTFTKL